MDPQIKIESTQAECHSLVLSVIRYMKSKVKELYRQCHKYGIIEQTQVVLYARSMAMNGQPPSIRIKEVGPQLFYNTSDPINQHTIFQLFFKNPIAFKRQYL